MYTNHVALELLFVNIFKEMITTSNPDEGTTSGKNQFFSFLKQESRTSDLFGLICYVFI